MPTPSERDVKHKSVLLNAVVDERYELLSAIGSGGMSEVYRARDLKIDREVAVKFMHPHLASDEDAIKRFQREAIATSELNHKNIVNAFAFGIWRDRPYIVMELLAGSSLADVLKEQGPLSRERAVPLFLQVLDALEFAHARGVVHRDLKPGNIMLVGEPPAVKVVDFGIAKILPESGKEMQRLTQTGELFGTVLYMSPEQCMTNPLDGKSDIYSLGCIMYETLEGEPPLVASVSLAVMAKHLNEEPADGRRIDPAFMHIIRHCLEKQPEKRPSASQLKTMLTNERTARYRQGTPASLKVSGSVALLLFAAGAWWWWQHSPQVPPRRPPHQEPNDSVLPQNELVGWLNHPGPLRGRFPDKGIEDEPTQLHKALYETDVEERERKLKAFIKSYGDQGGQYTYDVSDAEKALGCLYAGKKQIRESVSVLNSCLDRLRPYKEYKLNDYYDAVEALAMAEGTAGNPRAQANLNEEIVHARSRLLNVARNDVFDAETQLIEYYASQKDPAARQRAWNLLSDAEVDAKAMDKRNWFAGGVSKVKALRQLLTAR